jgi:tRNA dimethylallyltransferase
MLAEKLYDPLLPVMKAVGAAELMAHLAGQLTLDDAAILARRNSRRLAKRQLTWFRNQAGGWPRAATAEDAVAALIGESVASPLPQG